MENFSYHVPFYVVSGGVATQGHSSELAGGQVGLFNRQTFSVATPSGNGKEFFFAQGAIGGVDWYGYPVTESHKSPFFYAKDVDDMYLSMPQRLQNEEWVLGFNGAPSSVGLQYEKGKALRVKFLFTGQPTYRFFGGPKEYVVSYTPPEDCITPCDAGDCAEAEDCLYHTQQLVDKINNHTELRKFGVQAKIVTSTFAAVTPNMEKYCLNVCDNGTAVDLQNIKAQYPGKSISRIERVGPISTYQFCQRAIEDAPADFTRSGSVLQAVCGECPAGSTLVGAKDVYYIKRPLLPTDSLINDGAKDTYADTVGTAYGVSVDADKTFVAMDGGVAIVKIKAPAGAAKTALVADIIEFSHTEEASCTFTAPAAIAWSACGEGIASERTLMIKALNRPDCDADGDRIEDLKIVLAGVQGIQLDTITKVGGSLGCADDYTVVQQSIDCLPEDCLTNNVTFSYDDLPAFENKAWEVVPVIPEVVEGRKCGIRVTAGYIDKQFGNCSFNPGDYYETDPIKFELSLLQEDGTICDVRNWPSIQQTRIGQISRQSGEYIIREVVMKTDAYLKHIDQYSNNPRMREAFDMNLLDMVDRKAFYKMYYVRLRASYGHSYRNNEQEKFTAVFAFKESDDTSVFENSVLDLLSGKSDAVLRISE